MLGSVKDRGNYGNRKAVMVESIELLSLVSSRWMQRYC
jgi:hypothetical protein